MRPFKTLRLASRDYFHEWQISGCFVLALAAILGPMLVLFGLKFGIVGGMLDRLIDDPRNREIRPAGSGRYSQQWISDLQQLPGVVFAIPRTRSIAATMELKSDAASRIVPVEIISSAQGDPLLADIERVPMGLDEIVLSVSAAKKLNVGPGDKVDGSLARRFQGEKERVHLSLTVAAIASARAFPREGAFTSLGLMEALEDFRDGRAVPDLGWEGYPKRGERSYPGFRMYARSIYDVADLEKEFINAGIEVRTQVADIELVQRMDQNLSMVYWAIAIIGLVGFSLSLGANLWANVDRKRKELSVLRLVGFRTGDIIWFPMIQAFYTAVLGWLLALVIFFIASWAINDMLASQIAADENLCRLLPVHHLTALLLTAGSAILSAALAGLRSAKVEPSEGLREI
jgi:putative ABC transport system permease protein